MNRSPTSSKPARFAMGSALVVASLLVTGPACSAATATAREPAPDPAAAAAWRLLDDAGIRPVTPSAPAADFRLPLVTGGERTLADFRGRWLVLTFFATWCGPCRGELPTLEQLHRQMGGERLEVVGVSVDERRDPLPAFLRQTGVTFPVLWDEHGRTGRAYRASSIPISYVIDPSGRVVGVSRGARDWSALAGTLGALVEGPTAAEPTGQTVALTGNETSRDELELPSVLTPPTARVSLSRPTLEIGESFHLDIEIRWAGDFEDYLLHPPEVELPTGIEAIRTSASTDSQTGRNVLTYRVGLKALEAGRFALDPVELRYTPRSEETPVASRIAGPTVEVRPPARILGLSPAGFAAATGGGALLLGLAVFGFVRLRRNGASASACGDDPFAERRALFEEARRRRLGGDHAGFLECLATLDRQLWPDDEPNGELAQTLERARFGGYSPPHDELDRLQRRIERRLGELEPSPQERERARLKLREGERSAREH